MSDSALLAVVLAGVLAWGCSVTALVMLSALLAGPVLAVVVGVLLIYGSVRAMVAYEDRR